MQSVIEHLRAHAPANATFYRLVGRTPRGEYELFPRDSNSIYGLGEAPRGLLPGLYQVFYFDSTGRQIQTARVELNLTEATAAALGPIDGGGTARNAFGAESAAPRVPAAASGQLSLPLPLPPAAPLHPSLHADLAREQAAHRMTLETDQQRQSFVQNSLYARESGEALMINRMMRQELLELAKQSRTYSQDTYADLEKQLAAMRMLREAQKEVLQYVQEAIPTPQAQKPDLLPLAYQGIQVIHDIGMALVQARLAPQGPQAAPSAAAQPPPSIPAQPSPSDKRAKSVSPGAPRVVRQPAELPPGPAPFVLDPSTLPDRPESD